MKYYTLTEAAQKTGYASGDSLRTRIFRGQLKGVKMGRDWLLTDKDIIKLQKQGQHE